MNFFEEATLRLKQQLKVTEDKAVAAALGLSARAWSGRKERASFPDKELLALIAKRPDLGLDYDYITTGHSSKVYEEMAANMRPDPGAIGPRLTGAPAEYVELVGRVLAASRKGTAALQDCHRAAGADINESRGTERFFALTPAIPHHNPQTPQENVSSGLCAAVCIGA